MYFETERHRLLHVHQASGARPNTTHWNNWKHAAPHGNTLQHTATYGNTLQHTATHCNILQHTATHYNTLQHTATHCNTLQHTATTSSTCTRHPMRAARMSHTCLTYIAHMPHTCHVRWLQTAHVFAFIVGKKWREYELQVWVESMTWGYELRVWVWVEGMSCE